MRYTLTINRLGNAIRAYEAEITDTNGQAIATGYGGRLDKALARAVGKLAHNVEVRRAVNLGIPSDEPDPEPVVGAQVTVTLPVEAARRAMRQLRRTPPGMNPADLIEASHVANRIALALDDRVQDNAAIAERARAEHDRQLDRADEHGGLHAVE